MTLQQTRRVGLFITCLADLFRPRVGFAALKLLEDAGCTVAVPAQGCCGQPNFNGGDTGGARAVAARVIKDFAEFDYVVAPSGSCAAMIRCHYPELFPEDSPEGIAARALAARTWELVSFLHDVAGVRQVSARLDAAATYHDACAGLRELSIREQPRVLLNSVAELRLKELGEPELCCGFGGLFCVKYPEVSNQIAGRKCRDVLDTGAEVLIAGDLGCLLHMEGRLHRDGQSVRALHVAEVLAGMGAEDADADH